MKNKRSQAQLTKIGMGSLIGVAGFIILSFGSASGQTWLIRGGIVAITFATWMITWK